MNKRVKLFIPPITFLAMAGLLWFGLGRDPNVVPSSLINRPLPEFSMPGLFPGAGGYTNKDFLGRITVMNIWGSWCPPCHAEHPYLMEISEREKDIVLVGISYDYSQAEDREFLHERGNPFDHNIVDADGSLRIDMGATGAPETFLVDSKGMILYRHIGPIDNRVWAEKFAPLIAGLRK